MKTILLTILAVAILVAGGVFVYFTLPSRDADNTERTVIHQERITCSDGTPIDTTFYTDESLEVTIGGTMYELSQVVSASGARYANSDESFVFWNKGDVSTVYVNDEVMYEACTSGTPIAEDNGAATSSVMDLIRNVSVEADDVIDSPLTIEGEARGPWYFEATFPVILTNWDGLIIAEGYAEATSDWMTEEFVPFTAELEFTNPYTAGDPDFMKRGSLILKKSNASGLPEHDAAYEITVYFAE